MPTQIISDHYLKGPSGPCLQLLSDGEEFKYPAYQIPREDANNLAAEIMSQEAPPSCKLCQTVQLLGRGTKPRYHHPPSSKLPRDVDVIAHHMYTK